MRIHSPARTITQSTGTVLLYSGTVSTYSMAAVTRGSRHQQSARGSAAGEPGHSQH